MPQHEVNVFDALHVIAGDHNRLLGHLRKLAAGEGWDVVDQKWGGAR